jgi:hypothetical protein
MEQKNLHSMNEILILLAMGLIAGVLSGMVGIGGGIIIVPALVYFLGFSQHSAQGTVLCMFLLPIGILGVYNYWQEGFVEWRTALIMGITFILGSFFGSKFSISLDAVTVKRIFGAVIFLISLKMMWGK